MKTTLIAALIALSTLASPVAVAATPPPVQAFFEYPSFNGALLSPDGKHLAVKIGAKDKRIGLGVINLADMSVKPLAFYHDTDIHEVRWANNERLVFNTRDLQTEDGQVRYGPSLYSVRVDGTALKQLANRTVEGDNDRLGTKLDIPLLPWHTYLPDDQGGQNSEEVYVEDITFRSDNSTTVALKRLNVATGRHKAFTGPNGLVRRYLFDHRGEPRLALTLEKDKQGVHLRDAATGEWRELGSHAAYKITEGAYSPLGFGPDGTLYVQAYHGDKMALFVLDLGTGKLADKPVVSVGDFDFDGDLVINNGKLLGVNYLGDARGTVWLDKRMQEIQAEVDAKLVGTVNLLSIGRHQTSPWVLVQAYADTMPTSYILYNHATKTFTKVADTRPQIKHTEMARQTMVKVKARDGLEIPTWITIPKGQAKNLPMVVLVHGGPHVRGNEWGWEPTGQFLASRGYLVVEPEFRGSTGYGQKLYAAGFKQWGLKMQDDIADAARWAIAKGMADPARVCIAGASYGGYATLMGLVRDPDLYKCGINWVGVTDMDLLYTGSFRHDDDVSASFKKYGLAERVGDRVKDAQQLRDTSPILHAAKIRQPLLMAYGTEDKRVPIPHGRSFHEAVKAGNKQVEFIEYKGEGHNFKLVENRIDFWTRVERFLERHIGK
jgi:dipeptidyl aminopeptidase/acylaminoacyl peptidase